MLANPEHNPVVIHQWATVQLHTATSLMHHHLWCSIGAKLHTETCLRVAHTIKSIAELRQVFFILSVIFVFSQKLQVLSHALLDMLAQDRQGDISGGNSHERQLCLHQTRC